MFKYFIVLKCADLSFYLFNAYFFVTCSKQICISEGIFATRFVLNKTFCD